MKKGGLLDSIQGFQFLFHSYNHFKLINITILLSIFSICKPIYSQEEIDTNTADQEDSRITSSGASYGDKLTPGQHSQFTINYKVNSNLFIEIRGDVKVFGLIQVFKAPIMAKQYVSNKFYLFSGGEVEITRDYSSEAQLFKPQFKLINGFGYEVNQHFTIEAMHDLNFSEGNLGPFANPNMFSLKGKYKF